MRENDRMRTTSAELLKNMQAEPDFKHWLFWKVVHDGRVPFEDALDSGAAFARCSQESVRRYLKKEVSAERLYQLLVDSDSKEKVVFLKPVWTSFRAKEEEAKEMNRIVKNWKDLAKDDPFSALSQRGKPQKPEACNGDPSKAQA
jgi:hypothetical protein